jgi:hypothetical protein
MTAGDPPTGQPDYALVVKHLLAGGLAGAASRTVVSPLERTKILLQVQGPGQAAYRGVWPTLRQIWVHEGVLGFFKGNGTNVVRIAPYSAVQFAAYEKYKQVTPSLRPRPAGCVLRLPADWRVRAVAAALVGRALPGDT